MNPTEEIVIDLDIYILFMGKTRLKGKALPLQAWTGLEGG
jgi:hypothetical protein